MEPRDAFHGGDAAPAEGAGPGAAVSAEAAGASRRPSSVLTTSTIITGIAAGLLGLLHGGDMVQRLLGTGRFTVNDLAGATIVLRRSLASPPAIAIDVAQTAAWMALSVLAIVGGAMALGLSRGRARVGGAAAIIAVVAPLVLTIPAAVLSRYASMTFDNSFFAMVAGVLVLASGTGLVAGLLSCVLLLTAPRRAPTVRASVASGVVAITGALVLLGESAVALVRVLMSGVSWWSYGWAGLFFTGWPATATVTIVALLGMVLAGIGGGMALGSPSRLARAGGGFLLGALLIRVLVQEIFGGMFVWFQSRLSLYADLGAVRAFESVNTFLVPTLTGIGLLLVVAGLIAAAASTRRPDGT
ncbi:hypothetical protein ACFQRD_02230 [Brachybacterium sp. GCM10030268]|uniref:hypothetical protein n=1 Tax=Brachybacterium sp. GCM10030268 TaxID=3273382 RepID=UPI003609ED52